MSELCPKCYSAHVARKFDIDTEFDIGYICHDCGFEYSVLMYPDDCMESKYDSERYDGPAFDFLPDNSGDV